MFRGLNVIRVDTEKVDDSQATGECKAETKIDGLLMGTVIGGLSEGYAGCDSVRRKRTRPAYGNKGPFPNSGIAAFTSREYIARVLQHEERTLSLELHVH